MCKVSRCDRNTLKQISNGSEFPYSANQVCLGSFIITEIFQFVDFVLAWE
jgi:hypothetical protein